MKQPTLQPSPDDDDSFDALLRSARPQVPLPAAFHHSVWSRIEAAADNTFTGRLSQRMDRLLGFLARPVPAAAAVVLTAVAGLWLGSRDSGSPDSLAYIQSVSPFINHAQTAKVP